jgi:hypothetical protein
MARFSAAVQRTADATLHFAQPDASFVKARLSACRYTVGPVLTAAADLRALQAAKACGAHYYDNDSRAAMKLSTAGRRCVVHHPACVVHHPASEGVKSED